MKTHLVVLEVDHPYLLEFQVAEGNGDTYLRFRRRDGHWGGSDPWCRIDRLQARTLSQILCISPGFPGSLKHLPSSTIGFSAVKF